jgi:outer membrane receptor for Fe3+-dicitrate
VSLPKSIFKQSFFWSIAPTISWKKFDSTDETVDRLSQASSLSNINYGLNLKYGIHFSENTDFYLKYSFESLSFEVADSLTLLTKKTQTSSIGVGLSLYQNLHLELFASEELLLTSPSDANIAFKKITIPEFQTSYNFNFYKFQEASLGLALSGIVYLPFKSQVVNSKISYGGSGEFYTKMHNQSLGFGFQQFQLKTTKNTTNTQTVYWKYTWENL